MRLWKIVVDEAKKFVDMIPVRLTKVGGWLLKWPYSAIVGAGSHRSVFFVAIPRSGSTLLYDLAAWNEGPPRQVVGYGENCAMADDEGGHLVDDGRCGFHLEPAI